MTVVDHAPSPPPTPNCDPINDGYNAIRAFLDHLAEQGIVLVKHDDLHKVIGKAAQGQVLLAFLPGQSFTEAEQQLEEDRIAAAIAVECPNPHKLLDELYEIDQKELERERRALLRYDVQLRVRVAQDAKEQR